MLSYYIILNVASALQSCTITIVPLLLIYINWQNYSNSSSYSMSCYSISVANVIEKNSKVDSNVMVIYPNTIL